MAATESEAGGSEQLERSEELIGQARDAAHEALSDTPPAENLDAPGIGDGLDAEQEQPVPRPN
jgi:hypothetical protein